MRDRRRKRRREGDLLKWRTTVTNFFCFLDFLPSGSRPSLFSLFFAAFLLLFRNNQSFLHPFFSLSICFFSLSICFFFFHCSLSCLCINESWSLFCLPSLSRGLCSSFLLLWAGQAFPPHAPQVLLVSFSCVGSWPCAGPATLCISFPLADSV